MLLSLSNMPIFRLYRLDDISFHIPPRFWYWICLSVAGQHSTEGFVPGLRHKDVDYRVPNHLGFCEPGRKPANDATHGPMGSEHDVEWRDCVGCPWNEEDHCNEQSMRYYDSRWHIFSWTRLIKHNLTCLFCFHECIMIFTFRLIMNETGLIVQSLYGRSFKDMTCREHVLMLRMLETWVYGWKISFSNNVLGPLV